MGILKSAASPWASGAASVILHGVGLATLAGFAFSPPSAPPLARGKGGSSIDVSIRWEDEARAPATAPAPPPAPPAPALPPPAPLQVASIPPPTEPPIQEAELEPVIDHGTLSGELPSPPAAVIPPAPAEPEPPNPESIEPPRTAIVPPSPPPPPAVAPGAPGAEGPAVLDAGALRPVYPLACRRASHEGTAVVRVVIGEDGKPLRVEIVRSAGCRELDEAALDAARTARFRPARRWGRPVVSAIEQPFRFVLRG